MVDMGRMSSPLGHHVRHHVALAFKRELLPIHVRINCVTKVRHVPLRQVIMAPGLHGHHVQPHAVVVYNSVVVIIAVVRHHMFRNAHAPCHRVNGALGQSGPTVRFHVAAPMSFELDSTRVLVKSTLIRSIVTLIHALIMVPGPIGRHVRPRVASER